MASKKAPVAAKGRAGKAAAKLPAIKVRNLSPVLRSIETIRPDPRNTRTHTVEQVQGLAAGIRKFGWTLPVIIDSKGRLIAGHARLEAARLLAIPEIPTVTIDDWTEDERRAYMIADNRLAENAGWDWDRMRAEFGALKAGGLDLTLTGFSLADISTILQAPATPGQFTTVESPNVQYRCPKCKHEWSGKPR